MLPDLKLAVRLQDIDNRVAELIKEVSSLPKHIAEIEKKLESHERKLEADRAALTANQKDRKGFEGEIQVQQQKISKLKDQMLEAKTNEQYRAFQHEIEYCEKEIRRAEDGILDLMTESEPLERNVKTRRSRPMCWARTKGSARCGVVSVLRKPWTAGAHNATWRCGSSFFRTSSAANV